MWGRGSHKAHTGPIVEQPCWEKHRPKNPRGMRMRFMRPNYEQALLTVLTAAIAADNETDPREQKAVDAILLRSRALRKLSTDKLDLLRTKVIRLQGLNEGIGDHHSHRRARTRNEKRWRTLEHATRKLYEKDNFKVAAFLQALDILYADQALRDSEKTFRNELAKMLGVEGNRDRYDRLIDAKNNIETGGPAKEPEMAGDQKIDAVRHAFYTVLAAAVLADGEEKQSERAELEAITMRVRTLSHLNEPSRQKLRAEIVPAVKKNFESTLTQWDRVNEACDVLVSAGPAIATSAYLHAVDLTFADGDLEDLEEEYLAHLHKRLSPIDVDDAVELLRIKNEVKKKKNKRKKRKSRGHGH